MRRITSFESFYELHNNTALRIKRLDTNCFFPGESLKDSIENGSLFYEEYPEGLLLFIDEQNLYRMYYYLDNEKEFPSTSQPKPILIEELDSRNRRRSYIETFSEKLNRAGFVLEAHNVQLEADLSNQKEIERLYDDAKERIKSQGLAWGYCRSSKDKQQILELWRDYLKPTDVPVNHTCFDSDRNQIAFCVYDDENVVGVNWWTFRGKYCETRHIVTHPKYGRRGIGVFMERKAFVDAVQNCNCTAITYADILNQKSLKMLTKSGFQINERTSLQFLLEPRQNN